MTVQPRQSDFQSARLRTCRYCAGAVTEYCGVEVDPGCKLIRWTGGRMNASPMQVTILAMLLVAAGNPVSASDIIDRLYGDREDGGPDWATGAVRTQVNRLRFRLNSECAPVRISTRYTFGYSIHPVRRLAETIERGK